MSKRRDSFLKIGLPLLGVFLFLLIWQLFFDFSLLNNALFSSPILLFNKIFATQGLVKHIFVSITRLVISVFFGFVLGVIISFLLRRYKSLSFVNDLLSFFMAIPGISWAPLFIITIGFGDRTIIAVGILTAFFPVVYNLLHGFKDVDRSLLRTADILEYSSVKKLFKVEIPSMMNYILIGLKLSFARTWRTIIAVEMIAASLFGLGYMIFDARELLNVDTMFVGIFLCGLIFYLLELLLIEVLEKKTVIRWGVKSKHV